MAAESISLSVPVPSADFFDNSPLHTPSKVLKNLDLLSANGDFVKSSDYNDPSSAVSSPCPRRRRFSTHRTPDMRRRSFNSNTGVNYEQTICDEFSHINLTIKDRERRVSSAATSHESLADTPTKRFVCTRKVNESNQIVIAKILDDAGDEDETIEIIDLDEDEKVDSSARSHERNLYPNCDVNVWLRSCEKEIIEPVEGSVSGEIPSWINGSLLRYECSTLHCHDSSIEYFMCFLSHVGRNGPGSLKVGNSTYNHLFDAAALLHRFNITNGRVTYQNRFLMSDSYRKNLAANRIVVSEFATVASAPDPCQSIFER